MFHLEPISTTNLLTLVQIAAISLGFYFSYKGLAVATNSLGTASKSLAITTANAQVQLYNQMIVQGRELLFKYMEIFADQDKAKAAKNDQEVFLGILIGYYAGVFELRGVINMPQSTQKLMDAELKKLLDQRRFRDKWDEVSGMHSKEFNEHVRKVRGI
jgi:hypothetical protein